MNKLKTYNQLFENNITEIILDFRNEYPDGVEFFTGEYGIDIERCLDIINKSTKKENIEIKHGVFNGTLAFKISNYTGEYVIKTISNSRAYAFDTWKIVTIKEFIKINDLDKLFDKINKFNKFNL